MPPSPNTMACTANTADMANTPAQGPSSMPARRAAHQVAGRAVTNREVHHLRSKDSGGHAGRGQRLQPGLFAHTQDRISHSAA